MKDNIIIKRNTGMTLIETMISVFVLMLVVGAAISFLTFSQKQFLWVDTDQKIQADMRAALENMTINIRDAEVVCVGSDTNSLILRVPNINDLAIKAAEYDTYTYKVDPSDTTRLLLELVQSISSVHNGWGKKQSSVYDAVKQETTTTWLILDKMSNSSDSSPVALFSYADDTIVLPYNYKTIYSVTVTLQVSRQSVPGKYHTKSLGTSIRSRNSF
jgi:Tfp pilus assembly protein PilV